MILIFAILSVYKLVQKKKPANVEAAPVVGESTGSGTGVTLEAARGAGIADSEGADD